MRFLNEKDKNASTVLKVQWANGHWRQCIADILSVFSNEAVLNRLGLLDEPESAEEAETKESDTRLFFQLVTRTASQRSWSMASFSELPPLNFNGIVSDSVPEAQACLERVRKDSEIIRDAVSALDQHDHPELEASVLEMLLPAVR